MASISCDKAGRRTVQFVGADRKRRTIRLGEVSRKAAETVRGHVEQLNSAKIIPGTAVPDATARWVKALAVPDPRRHGLAGEHAGHCPQALPPDHRRALPAGPGAGSVEQPVQPRCAARVQRAAKSGAVRCRKGWYRPVRKPRKSRKMRDFWGSRICRNGWGGIRTPAGLSPRAVFKTAALDHSATHPKPKKTLPPVNHPCMLGDILCPNVKPTTPQKPRPDFPLFPPARG